MVGRIRNLFKAGVFALLGSAIFGVTVLHAATVEVQEGGYGLTGFAEDASGGFDFLPDGDVVAFNGTELFVFDTNGDGSPASPDVLYTLAGSVYGSFVKVSPSGEFAIFGESSTGKIYKHTFATGVTEEKMTLDYNFDLVFMGDHAAYLSANPAFGQPNQIYLWDLIANELEVVAEINAPSGALTLDPAGNLYYVKGTYDYPAPPASYALLRFDSADLCGVIFGDDPALQETDAQEIARLDAGFDLELTSSGYALVSGFNGFVYKVNLSNGGVQNFVEVTAGFTGFSAMAFYKTDGFTGPLPGEVTKLAFFSDDWSGTKVLYIVSPENGIPFSAPIFIADLDGNMHDDVVVDFGEPYGIWIYYSPAGTWTKVHPLSCESIIEVNAGEAKRLAIDFGAPYGIWIYDVASETWERLHRLSPKNGIAADINGDGYDEYIIDFSAHGIWIYYPLAGEWSKLHSLSPEFMVSGDLDGNGKADITVDFGDPHGVWIRYNDSNWQKLHSLSP